MSTSPVEAAEPLASEVLVSVDELTVHLVTVVNFQFLSFGFHACFTVQKNSEIGLS